MNLKMTGFIKNYEVEVSSTFELKSNTHLDLKFQVAGKGLELYGLTKLLPENERQRKDELWTKSCFECFIKGEGERYFEVNLSPLGHWQIYSFDSYRNKRETSSNLKILNLNSDIEKDAYSLSFSLDLQKVAPVTALHPTVVLSLNDMFEYYATKHPISRPDFHDSTLWTKI